MTKNNAGAQASNEPDIMLGISAQTLLDNAAAFWRGIVPEEEYKRQVARVICNVYWWGKIAGLNFAASQTREMDTRELFYREIDKLLGVENNGQQINSIVEGAETIAKELNRAKEDVLNGDR